VVWVKFVREFEFDFRPIKACCQIYQASETPQNLPERVVEAAVKAGAGVRVDMSVEDRIALQRAKGRKQKG